MHFPYVTDPDRKEEFKKMHYGHSFALSLALVLCFGLALCMDCVSPAANRALIDSQDISINFMPRVVSFYKYFGFGKSPVANLCFLHEFTRILFLESFKPGHDLNMDYDPFSLAIAAAKCPPIFVRELQREKFTALKNAIVRDLHVLNCKYSPEVRCDLIREPLVSYQLGLNAVDTLGSFFGTALVDLKLPDIFSELVFKLQYYIRNYYSAISSSSVYVVQTDHIFGQIICSDLPNGVVYSSLVNGYLSIFGLIQKIVSFGDEYAFCIINTGISLHNLGEKRVDAIETVILGWAASFRPTCDRDILKFFDDTLDDVFLSFVATSFFRHLRYSISQVQKISSSSLLLDTHINCVKSLDSWFHSLLVNNLHQPVLVSDVATIARKMHQSCRVLSSKIPIFPNGELEGLDKFVSFFSLLSLSHQNRTCIIDFNSCNPISPIKIGIEFPTSMLEIMTHLLDIHYSAVPLFEKTATCLQFLAFVNKLACTSVANLDYFFEDRLIRCIDSLGLGDAYFKELVFSRIFFMIHSLRLVHGSAFFKGRGIDEIFGTYSLAALHVYSNECQEVLIGSLSSIGNIFTCFGVCSATDLVKHLISVFQSHSDSYNNDSKTALVYYRDFCNFKAFHIVLRELLLIIYSIVDSSIKMGTVVDSVEELQEILRACKTIGTDGFCSPKMSSLLKAIITNACPEASLEALLPVFSRECKTTLCNDLIHAVVTMNDSLCAETTSIEALPEDRLFLMGRLTFDDLTLFSSKWNRYLKSACFTDAARRSDSELLPLFDRLCVLSKVISKIVDTFEAPGSAHCPYYEFEFYADLRTNSQDRSLSNSRKTIRAKCTGQEIPKISLSQEDKAFDLEIKSCSSSGSQVPLESLGSTSQEEDYGWRMMRVPDAANVVSMSMETGRLGEDDPTPCHVPPGNNKRYRDGSQSQASSASSSSQVLHDFASQGRRVLRARRASDRDLLVQSDTYNESSKDEFLSQISDNGHCEDRSALQQTDSSYDDF